jgi:hypothetical protein
MNTAQFKPNHPVSFTMVDTFGEHPQKGWVKDVSEQYLSYYHEEGGECMVPLDSIQKPTVGKKAVKRSDMVIKRPTPEKEPKRYDASAGAKAPKPGSKQEAVSKIYNANSDKSRKEIIALIVEQVGMSAAGASTYYQNAKKAAEAA